MVSPREHHVITFDEYVEIDAMGEVKHEFLDGQVRAMAGGTPDHAALAANVVRLLGNQLLDRPCRVYSSDLRIRVQETGLATYPDVTVVCGRLELDPEDKKKHTAVNPIVLVEVLSPSTEVYDRGAKLAHYKRIPSLMEIVLVAQDQPKLEVWRRIEDRWTLDVFDGEASASLGSIDCELPLAEVYRNPLAP